VQAEAAVTRHLNDTKQEFTGRHCRNACPRKEPHSFPAGEPGPGKAAAASRAPAGLRSDPALILDGDPQLISTSPGNSSGSECPHPARTRGTRIGRRPLAHTRHAAGMGRPGRGIGVRSWSLEP